jgi:hypothetical protein
MDENGGEIVEVGKDVLLQRHEEEELENSHALRVGESEWMEHAAGDGEGQRE